MECPRCYGEGRVCDRCGEVLDKIAARDNKDDVCTDCVVEMIDYKREKKNG